MADRPIITPDPAYPLPLNPPLVAWLSNRLLIMTYTTLGPGGIVPTTGQIWPRGNP
jgi:hypothetical protein